MELENIIVEKKGHVSTITINRPPANAWSLQAFVDFESALDHVENDKEVRAIIITGAGEKCFSAGYDVTDFANIEKSSPLGQKLFRRVDRFEKPTIAAINGHALGGGCELAMSCHFRIMADKEKAAIGCTELNLGVLPGWGGTQLMPHLVGRSKALDLILLSKKLGAQEALEIGLVDKVAAPEDLMKDAMEYAELVAARPPIAVACVLKAMSAGKYEGVDQGLKVELESVKLVSKTEDAREGTMAFMQKRTPIFKGE